jgi:hypothetical protein
MADWWVDWINGNDTDGNGSPSAPYKTIAKALSVCAAGDHIKHAKSPAHASLPGTLTFTDNSTTVATSTDLTGIVAPKDFVGKASAGGPGSAETFWEVASVTSNTITLVRPYSGVSETTTGKKCGVIDVGAWGIDDWFNAGNYNAPETIQTQISGGWNLSTQTRDGETWIWNSGSTKQGKGANLVYGSGLILDGFGFLRFGTGIYLSSTHRQIIRNISVLSNSGRGVDQVGFASIFENVAACGNGIAGIWIESADFLTGKNITACSNADNGIHGVASNGKVARFFIENLVARNNGWRGIGNCFLNSRVRGFTAANNPLGNISLTTTYTMETPMVGVQDFNGNTRTVIFEYGTITYDTTNQRGPSGGCLAWMPSNATRAFGMPVGFAKAPGGKDFTLSIYLKKSATFDGTVELRLWTRAGWITEWTTVTPTTSYAQYSLTGVAADLPSETLVYLYMRVKGTAGAVYSDDFSAAGFSTDSFDFWEMGMPWTQSLPQTEGGCGFIIGYNIITIPWGGLD